jgi:hypothetical protein
MKVDRKLIIFDSHEERQKIIDKKFFIELSESFYGTKVVYPDIEAVIFEIEAFIDEDVDPVYFKIRPIEMSQKEFESLKEFEGY